MRPRFDSEHAHHGDKMVVLKKISWKEFEKIMQIVREYKSIAMKINREDGSWFDRILSLLSKVKKQRYNIEVRDLKKEDFNRITIIVDIWNGVKNLMCIENRIPYDGECDKIRSKLKKAYFEIFNETVFPT